MESKILLTIAIPTYNRLSQLRRTLSMLLPQLDIRCKVMIIDNHSDTIMESEVKDIIDKYPELQYSWYRNNVNIGANANIHRCFELCTTPWMWLLSDDDCIAENAIKTIFDAISKYPDAVNINFYSPHDLHPVRNRVKQYYGKKGYINSIDFFGATIFMSSNIYNMSKISTFYESCHRVYSCVSQWMIVFFNLNKDSLVVTSDETIVVNDFFSDKYSSYPLDIINGFISMLDILMSTQDRRDLTKKVLSVERAWISYQSIIKILVIEYYKRHKEVDVIYHIERYFKRFYKYGTKKNWVVYFVCRTLASISIELLFNTVRLYSLRHTNGNLDIKKIVDNGR